ncbi:MAG: phage tail protein I [Candidatus Nanoarchaeia archaeon]|nr:phage tail protein I [Candidatus Nanoarchaeia archaeon]
MMRLSNADIMKLIPGFMRDDEAVEALAKAVNELVTGPGGKVGQLRVWDKIDELGHAELDELAWELNVDWYSSALELERKRETIKVSDQVHSKRGTKWAVEQLVGAYFGSGYVSEWFDAGYPFDPSPFHFIVLTAKGDMTDAVFQEFIRITKEAISARSKLDGVFYLKEYNALVICQKQTSSHLFGFKRCGTKPRRAWVGAIRENGAIASRERTAYLYEFPELGIKAGTYPRTATGGSLITREAAALYTVLPYRFSFMRCGTRRCGQV